MLVGATPDPADLPLLELLEIGSNRAARFAQRPGQILLAKIPVAPLIGNLDRVLFVVPHHRLKLGSRDVGAPIFRMLERFNRLFACFYRHGSAQALNGFVMVTPSICCPCCRSSL